MLPVQNAANQAWRHRDYVMLTIGVSVLQLLLLLLLVSTVHEDSVSTFTYQ